VPPPLVDEVTVNLTGTVADAAFEVTLTEALHVPTARLAGFTDTPMELGVVPLVLVADSQLADDLASVKLIALPLLLVTDAFCAAGDDPPCWKPKASEVSVTTSVGLVDVVSVTRTLTEL
jgi:hypothetical protein